MANIGEIKQFKGPFSNGYEITAGGNCIIGISISEDDYMKLGTSAEVQSKTNFSVEINGETIEIGRTFIYETGDVINNTIIKFPKGAPLSTIVDVVYCASSVD